jgi:hypothetical protein
VVHQLEITTNLLKQSRTRNDTVTSFAMPILVDCGPDQKADRLATWAGSGLDAKRVKIFTKADAPKQGIDLFKALVELRTAVRKKDNGKAAKTRKRLHEIIERDNKDVDVHFLRPLGKWLITSSRKTV